MNTIGQRHIIVGAGLAGAKAAQALRKEGHDGPITLLGAEAVVPYNRPPLSKEYLNDAVERSSINVHPEGWYARKDIDLRLDSRVSRLDVDRHRVVLATGEQLDYAKLLLTTGCRVRRLSLPGADLEGVLYLRAIGDSDRIRQALREEDLTLAVEDMAAAANSAGGHDNITVVLADVVAQDDGLDGEQSRLVGSALEREIPSLASPTPGESSFPTPTVGDDGVEAERYAPRTSPRRWPGVVAGALVVLLVLGGGAWGVVAYSTSRFYIAEAGGSVAIYNGLPGSLLGFKLSTLSEQTNIQVSDLPRFYQRTVNNTIAASDLSGALESVAELRNLAERCVAAREERKQPVETPQPTPLPTPTSSAASSAPALSTGQPNYPTYLAPITPTASEESDPEAC